MPKSNVSLEIAVEDYILGLRRKPTSWATQGNDALKAQVIAAPSYT